MSAWLIGLIVLLAIYALVLAALAVVGRREQVPALLAFVPDCVVLLRRLAGDSRTPRWGRPLLALLALYLISPIDLIPDFLPVVGQLDDIVIVVLVLRLLLRATGSEPVREHWPGSETSLGLILRAVFGRSRDAE
ncbi:MAG: DUF1232 domain-containing protein [Actinobacteria bacterium]|nr:DUF1232 domain-containing protein [Actinomycetota bacterium]